MNALTDQQLLRDYAANRMESAFAELVRRHVDLVYSAALRLVRDAHLAEDVTQSVFIALAQNAGQLTGRPVLAGWLHRTTQNLAANVVRAEVRRRTREQEAVAMNELLEPDAIWEQIAPQLDTALGELNEADRDALLLRYFQRQSARDMAQSLGVSEDAAQKRVNRAVDRLRENFAQRGITVGASGLGIVITANAVHAAPIGLAATISSAAAVAGTALQTSTVIVATKTIVMTTLQKTLITAALTITVGAGIFEAHQAAQRDGKIKSLQRQQASLTEQVAQLMRDNESLSNHLADDGGTKKLSTEQFNELLKLRGDVGVLRHQLGELAKLREENQSLRDQASAEQSQTNQISPEEQFKLQEWHTTDALKQIGLAMRIYAGDHNDQYATNFDQLKDQLDGVTNFSGNISLNTFEFLNAGIVNDTMPDMIIFRERVPRQCIPPYAIGGTIISERAYGMADGSVQTIHSDHFDEFEKQHSPPPNQ